MWEPYNKLHISNYKKVHYNVVSNVMVLQVNTRENTFVRVTQKQFNTNLLDLLIIAATEQQAHLASAGHSTLKALDPYHASKNFQDTMSRKNQQEWVEALNKEYKGYKDCTTLAVVKPLKGARILGTLTRWEYKEDTCRLVKYKVRMVIRGDQQVEGESFTSSDLYAPVVKAPEALLILAMAAAEGCSVYKTNTSQAFLYGSMGDDVVYIKAPDWWSEPISEGHCLQLLKSIYGTRQAASRWHIHISDWMEKNSYPAVNSEKTIFMKREGEHFIILCLFVDDMMHTTTSTSSRTS